MAGTAVNRLVIGKMLEQVGCIVQFGTNGEEALALLDSGTAFDLIFMDRQMPVMDGLETTRQIRSRSDGFRTIPIVGLSAGVLPEEIAACTEAGMDGFLAKPLLFPQLSVALSEYLA